MPRGNRTGPEGNGPQTGRAMGFCSGSNAPGFTRGYIGRGMGFGRGMGRGYNQVGPGRGIGGGRGGGMGRGYSRQGPGFFGPDQYRTEPDRPSGGSRTYSEPSPEEEKKYLEDLVKGMETELEDIRKRIGDLTKEE